jgi:hypothetical protein
VIGRGTISPVVLVGRLVQLKQIDPDFVCPRCQGMHPESRIMTFCPSCAAPRDDSVLHTCANCEYDFQTGLPAEELWQQIDPASLPTADRQRAAVAQTAIPAAWYPDPYGAPQLRWWDGSTWTQHTHETTTTP